MYVCMYVWPCVVMYGNMKILKHVYVMNVGVSIYVHAWLHVCMSANK